MYTGKFDLFTLLIYVSMGIFCSICLRASLTMTGKHEKRIGHKVKRFNRYDYLLVFVLVLFATLRKVDYRIGGADALNYVNIFGYCLANNSPYKDMVSEPLFILYCKAIRSFTSDYKVFFAITYGIIATAYCCFIKEYCPRNISTIPLIVLVFPYLRGFCTLRSSLAIAVIQFGLVNIKKHKVISAIMMIASFFIHRMSIMYSVINVFYYLYQKRLVRMKRIGLILFMLVFLMLSTIASRIMQSFIISRGLLDGTDAWYLRRSMGTSLFARWPMFIAQAGLLIMMTLLSRQLKAKRELNDLRIFCYFDFIMIPASLVLGFWRANEFMYLTRLIMWGECIDILTNNKSKVTNVVLKYTAGLIAVSWLVFRIYSEWDDLKIIPYILEFL